MRPLLDLKQRLNDLLNGQATADLHEHTVSIRGKMPSGGQAAVLTGEIVVELLQDLTSGLNGPAVFKGVEFSSLHILGNVDLNSLGTVSEPIISFVFHQCAFYGGLHADQSYLGGVELKNCRLAKDPSRTAAPTPEAPVLSFVGSFIANYLRISSLHLENTGSVLACSTMQASRGCFLSDIGGPCPKSLAAPETPQGNHSLERMDFEGANITGTLQLEGVWLESTIDRPRTFNGDELTVKGSLLFYPSARQQTKIVGMVRLMGAEITGQVIFKCVEITAHIAEKNGARQSAIVAQNVHVHSDIFFRDDYEIQPIRECKIVGIVDLVSAQVQGDLQFYGDFNADNRMRAIKARAAQVGGSVHFGWVNAKAHRCNVIGECDLTNALIKGRVVVGAADIQLTPRLIEQETTRRRSQEYALNLTGATILNDLRLESGFERTCCVEGVGLIGATIGGRLSLRGAKLVGHGRNSPSTLAAGSSAQPIKERKALSANGVTIRGGITLIRDPYCGADCHIEGDIRLRNATVNGPVIFKGCLIQSTGSRGIALWATNTHFGSDVIFELQTKQDLLVEGQGSVPRPEKPCFVSGEVRLAGSTIEGSLLLQGAILCAGSTGAALDGYRLEVKNDIVLGPHSKCDPEALAGSSNATVVFGVINLEFARATSMTLGAQWPQIRIPPPALEVYGALIMRGMELRGTMMIVDALLRPLHQTEPDPIRQANIDRAETTLAGLLANAESNLREHSVFRSQSILFAVYAKLGTRMYVRLNRGSRGLINLYGASTGTIGSLSIMQLPKQPDHQPHVVPKLDWLEKQEIQEDWGGFPDSEKDLWPVELNLGEFCYKNLNDRHEEPGDDKTHRTSLRIRLWYRFIGRPLRENLLPRYDWLARQIDVTHVAGLEATSPQRQIAKVYRDLGNFTLANSYTIERRWIQVSARQPLRKAIEWTYGFCFGFGYNSVRAVGTLFALFLLSLTFTLAAARTETSDVSGLLHTGQLIDVRGEADPALDACAFHGEPWPGALHAALPGSLEAAKMILPFSRLEKAAGCVLSTGPKKEGDKLVYLLRPWRGLIIVLSWIVFPLAAVTITGILRESTQ